LRLFEIYQETALRRIGLIPYNVADDTFLALESSPLTFLVFCHFAVRRLDVSRYDTRPCQLLRE